MTKEKVDLFTLGFVVGENGEMESNDRDVLVQHLQDVDFSRPVTIHFLLALPKIEEKTKGGIYLSVDTKDLALVGNNIGRIIGIGKGVGIGKGGSLEEVQEFKVGDYVAYNPHAGIPEHYRGQRVLCIMDDAIKMVVPDPTQHSDGIFKAFSINGINNV